MQAQKLYLPYERESLAKCRDEVNGLLINSSVEVFESLMSSFPRRIIFMTNGSDVTGVLLRINANRTFYDFDAVGKYYHELKEFHDKEVQLWIIHFFVFVLLYQWFSTFLAGGHPFFF